VARVEACAGRDCGELRTMSLTAITHQQLWKAPWSGLCRLGRSLGLRVRVDEPETQRRGPLVEAVMRALTEDMLRHAKRPR